MRNKKKIFSLRALLFAVLVTASVSSVTLSRYLTTVSGTATAQIAQFNVKLVPTEMTEMKFDQADNIEGTEVQSYDFSVSSNSDVASEYEIKVIFAQGLPNTVVPTIDNIEGVTDNNARTSFTFTSEDFKLEMGENKENSHTLTLTRTYFTNDQMVMEDMEKISVTISVTAKQIMNTQ